jgi:predicted lipoprotein with Yx(FWY)xxD motif
MKSSTILGLGAVCVVILTATAVQRFWLSHTRASSAEAITPIATPPGITMQLVNRDDPAGGASVQQIDFADAKGMTLYTYARDTVGNLGVEAVSACVGDCARTWRPALAAQDPEGATDWSVLRRADGSKQWCYRGAPLYAFADDEAPGDIKGESSGGDAWRAATFFPEVGMVLPDSITVRHLPDAGGTALASVEGLTLYAFEEKPSHPPVGCGVGSDCARTWQPFEAGAIANPAGDFTVIARPDGIMQWAYRSQPLYLFTGDRKPGEVRGIGVDVRFHVALVRRYFMPADATVRWITGLGNVLATRSGATLYERDRIQPGEDNHDFHAEHGPPALGRWYGTSTCDPSCARTWPPYVAPADAVASGYWEVLTRTDGRKQWAYKGFALYRYSGDPPGEARGNRLYEIVRIDDVGPGPEAHTVGTTHTPLQLSARDEAAYVKFAAPGNAAGIGVGALFWHAVVP